VEDRPSRPPQRRPRARRLRQPVTVDRAPSV
jgi:hypothetical protein